MRIQHFLAVAALVAGVGGLIVPSFAQAPGQGMGQMENGGTMGGGMMNGGGMTSGDMMSGGGMMSGMMGGGCARMMQSMNGSGQPNSQWQAKPHRDATPD